MTFKHLGPLFLAACISIAMHLLLGIGINAALQGKQAPLVLKNAGAPNALSVSLATSERHAASTFVVDEKPPAAEQTQAQESPARTGPKEQTAIESEALTSAGHFYSPNEVDYPAEFLGQVDFDAALQGLPMPHATVRLQVFIDAKGLVKAVRWENDGRAAQVMQHLTEYISAQAFRPAMKGGAPVASRLRLEFDVGSVIREPNDLPVIPMTRAPAGTH